MRLTRALAAGLLAAAALAVARPSAAQSPACTVEVTPLEFGDYDTFDTRGSSAVGEVRVRCPSGAAISHVEISPGQSADFQKRLLVGAGGALTYNIYADLAGQRIVGDGTGGTVVLTPNTRTKQAFRPLQRFLFYGRVAPGQFERPGEYLDVLRVIVVF